MLLVVDANRYRWTPIHDPSVRCERSAYDGVVAVRDRGFASSSGGGKKEVDDRITRCNRPAIRPRLSGGRGNGDVHAGHDGAVRQPPSDRHPNDHGATNVIEVDGCVGGGVEYGLKAGSRFAVLDQGDVGGGGDGRVDDRFRGDECRA